MVKLPSCSLVGFSMQKRLFKSLLLVLFNSKKFTRCPANYGHESNWPTADMDTYIKSPRYTFEISHNLICQ